MMHGNCLLKIGIDWLTEVSDSNDWHRPAKVPRQDIGRSTHYIGATVRYSTQIRSISYLKANAAEVLQVLEEQHKPMIITQNGEAKAVIQDFASYEKTQETLALFTILALSSQQIERGEITPISEIAGRLRAKAISR